MAEAELLTLAEAAQVLRISIATIKRHVYAGRIPATKIGGLWRIRRRDLERLLEPSAPTSPPRASRASRRRPSRGK